MLVNELNVNATELNISRNSDVERFTQMLLRCTKLNFMFVTFYIL